MFRVAIAAAFLSLILFNVGGVPAAASGRPHVLVTGTTVRPQLRVVELRPFAVVGTGFRPGEMVRVTVRADRSAASARDGAAANGRIGVRFQRLRLGKCPTYAVAAWGNKGSRAAIRSVPRPCGIDP